MEISAATPNDRGDRSRNARSFLESATRNNREGFRTRLTLVPRFEFGNPLRDHLPNLFERDRTTLIRSLDRTINCRESFRVYLSFSGRGNVPMEIFHVHSLAAMLDH